MRVLRSAVLLVSLCLFATAFLDAQSAPTSSNQGLTTLQNALAALAGEPTGPLRWVQCGYREQWQRHIYGCRWSANL
jgi:hypothetical protein